ncbi:lytic polysaccharide monooxygenase [Candidatus Enterococcus ikei]|uniref:Lytic polysaccharide monooxygenase n=1 Tax=Candidatus Enterococcus ikei TaxID=2815326 RepID=A0ABS3H141_9ENTE|nr:lytic polysaccharide monooxygenase [Enterococcus sp. DIV0869a]MBO0441240.1 lytic polysaccharide monooxygenase [Enterococcus sp. DIV0869a]
MKKNVLSITLAVSIILGGLGVLTSQDASAHGYISNPPSRAYYGALEKNTIGYQAAQQKYGAVINEPQSLETGKGFSIGYGINLAPWETGASGNGPADGKIVSANDALGSQISVQKDNYWKMNDINPGKLDITWHYTATHATSRWTYYITKNGWNPNSPIKRSDLQLIKNVPFTGAQANTSLTHTVDIPADHTGYHVLLGVWDVSNTGAAFYQAVDVNIKGGAETIPPKPEKAPNTPTNVTATDITTTSAKLTWTAGDNVQEYNIYRNNQKIATTSVNTITDGNLKENTTYNYQVEAVGQNGQISEKSNAVNVLTKTAEQKDTQNPTAATGLHSMATTETSVDLMWTKSEHFLGIKNYEVYRDGKKITTITNTNFKDAGLTAGTTYTYTVKAFSLGGNASEFSAPFTVTTKKEIVSSGETTSDKSKVYNSGDEVFYNGLKYQAKWWTQNEKPEESDVWKSLSNSVLEWSAKKAYNSGERVTFQGKTYQAKWWVKGAKPSTSYIWKLV